MKVRQGLLKFISPDAQAELKLAVARLSPPEPLTPEDLLTAVFVLCFDKDRTVAEVAAKGFSEVPTEVLIEALEKRLDPQVIKKAVSVHGEKEAVLIMAAMNPATDDSTLKTIAETGPEEVAAVFIDEIELIRAKPFILEALKNNPHAPKPVIGEIESRLGSAPGPVKDRTAHAEAPRALKDEKEGPDTGNIYQAVKEMSMGQKIKLALCGNKSAREFLVKDANKMVSLAVLKNPRITEDEVHKVINSKGTPEDLLRLIARNKEWVKSQTIKMGMVLNPKTPLPISLKYLDGMMDADLQKLSKSKNIPSVVAAAARRKLDAKAKK